MKKFLHKPFTLIFGGVVACFIIATIQTHLDAPYTADPKSIFPGTVNTISQLALLVCFTFIIVGLARGIKQITRKHK